MIKEKPLWGLHMREHHGSAPVDAGYITIGWHEFGDASAVAGNREAFKARFAATVPGSKPGNIPVSAGQIFRFVHEMKVGDVVVFPSKYDRMVNIGEISGLYEYRPDLSSEYPHRRSVTWHRHISRDEFSQSALYEIGSALTLFRVTSHAEEFLAALSGAAPKTEDVDDAPAATVIAEQLEENTEDFVIKRLKQAQSAYEFEHFVAHLLECMGYHARVTQASGDGGVDIIAHRDELGFEPPT
jgi:restriction system protein